MKIKDETYKKLIEIGKDIEQASLDVKKGEARNKLRQAAKDVFNLCRELDTDNPEPLKWLGYVYFHDGDLEKAEEIFKEGMEMAGDEGLVKFGNPIGNVYKRRGDFKKAVEWYKKVQSIKSHPVHLMNIAMVYDKWGKREKAKEYAKKGLSLYEESPDDFSDLLYKNLTKLKEEGYDWE